MHWRSGLRFVVCVMVVLLLDSVGAAQEQGSAVPMPSVAEASPRHAAPGFASLRVKKRRLAISGWSLVTAGIALPIAAVLTQGIDGRGQTADDKASSALIRSVTLAMAGVPLLVAGGALLIRRRVLINRHARLRLSMGIGALAVDVAF
jgi:hypothetical protein